jgi:hypothetical protein
MALSSRLHLIAVLILTAAAMLLAGPVETSLQRSCSSYAPSPAACSQW